MGHQRYLTHVGFLFFFQISVGILWHAENEDALLVYNKENKKKSQKEKKNLFAKMCLKKLHAACFDSRIAENSTQLFRKEGTGKKIWENR